MNVTLYKYTGDAKKLSKTLPSTSGTYLALSNVYLKDASSVTHPSLLIQSSTSLADFNYCYIQEFNRYYFMEVDSISNSLWEFKCSVDVLMSNATAISGTNAYIERTSGSSLGTLIDDLLIDDAVSFKNTNTITITNLSAQTQGNLKTINLKNVLSSGSYNVTLSVINDLSIQAFDEGGTMYDVECIPPITNMSKVTYPEENGATYYNYIYVASLVELNTSLKNIYQETKASFIKSVVAWPFVIDTLKTTDSEGHLTNTPILYTMRLGSENWGSNNVAKLKYGSIGFLTFFDYTFPTPSSPHYYDYEPYTTYELFIPYIGWRTINIKDVEGSRILMSIRLSFETGKSTIYLINYTKNYVIASYDAQIGVTIPISRTNLEELTAQALSNAIGMALGVVGGAVTTSIGLASGNPVAIAGGVMGAVSSVTKGVQSNIGMFEKGQSQVKDGNSGLDNRNVMLKVTKRDRIIGLLGYQMGYPVHKSALISSCSGFTKGIINRLDSTGCSKWERDEIIRLFHEGIVV